MTTPCLEHRTTETEVEARIRLGRPGSPATEAQLRAGAALGGVYYPAQQPYVGHNEDLLFQEGDSITDARARFWTRWWWLLSAVVVGASLYGALTK